MPWTFGKIEFSSREKQHPVHDSNCIAVCVIRTFVKLLSQLYFLSECKYVYKENSCIYMCLNIRITTRA